MSRAAPRHAPGPRDGSGCEAQLSSVLAVALPRDAAITDLNPWVGPGRGRGTRSARPDRRPHPRTR